MSTIHVVGAGLAGLAAALSLVEAGRRVIVHEAGPAPGGRCRSYFDRGLGLRIDNGNHLLLSGNRAAMAYLDQIGTRHMMGGPGFAHFPFMDLTEGLRWNVAPGNGRVPWWVMSRSRRVPGTRLRDYSAFLSLRRAARGDATVASVFQAGVLYRRLIEPLAVSALNTRPEHGLARLLFRVVAESLLLGGHACVPSFPRTGLSESLIDPAVAWLRARGAVVQFGRRVGWLRQEGQRAVALGAARDELPIGRDDAVVLAVPPWVAQALLPQLIVPDAFEAILNLHFLTIAEPGLAGFCGLVGGTAEWVFVKQGVVSVTVSAANHLVDLPAEVLAERVWPDVHRALDLPPAMPPVRVVKERRATFAATAEQDRRRPGPRTGLVNVALAGDWTATGLPATIEGAIRSGRNAARVLLAA
jgi:squalene-associated FAD-dependent desaturase